MQTGCSHWTIVGQIRKKTQDFTACRRVDCAHRHGTGIKRFGQCARGETHNLRTQASVWRTDTVVFVGHKIRGFARIPPRVTGCEITVRSSTVLEKEEVTLGSGP